jgi:cobalt-zinc-cadmium efflux system outer membrane protein
VALRSQALKDGAVDYLFKPFREEALLEAIHETLKMIEAPYASDTRRQCAGAGDRRGEASFVEYLDARRASNDTTQNYNEARAEYARSLYLIDSIIGKAPR